MFRYDMRDKTPQQRAIVRERDNETNTMKAQAKNQQVSKVKQNWDTSIFMKLGKHPYKNLDGYQTINLYECFYTNNSSVWFSTNSLHKGMDLQKVNQLNNAIKQGNNIEIYFAIGKDGGGKNDIEFKANVLRIVSNKYKTPTPDILLTPPQFANDENYIWIKINNIQRSKLTTNDFIVKSTGNTLSKSIEKSQYHFGYIQRK